MAGVSPNQRVMWWEERVRQEEKSLLKLVKAVKRHASNRRAADADGGIADAERRARRHELAKRVHATEKAVAAERIARFRADGEALELSAMVEKLDERMVDPVVLNARRAAGTDVSAALYGPKK